MRKAALIGAMLGGVMVAHVTGTRGAERSRTAPPVQPAAVAMDTLVDKVCGSDPVERKLALRLERARLDEKAVTATKRCFDAQAHAAVRGDLKLLRGLDAAVELSLRGCLQGQDVHAPAVIGALTDTYGPRSRPTRATAGASGTTRPATPACSAAARTPARRIPTGCPPPSR